MFDIYTATQQAAAEIDFICEIGIFNLPAGCLYDGQKCCAALPEQNSLSPVEDIIQYRGCQQKAVTTVQQPAMPG